MSELVRRRFLQIGAITGASLLAPIRFAETSFARPLPGRTVDPTAIRKYVTPLVIPPAMPPTKTKHKFDYYEIAVRQFRQQILPPGLPATTVWSYGSVDHPSSFNYPAFTIEARNRRSIQVKWINDLVDKHGCFLPHLLPIDQTLHWANPPGGKQHRDSNGTDQTP